MLGIPITIIIAFLGVILTAYFQKQHWLRATREEIRVRETNGASELAQDIAKIFDRRIAAQRSLLRNIDSKSHKNYYFSAIREYGLNYNDIRYRLYYYIGMRNVVYMESNLNDRVVYNAREIDFFLKNGRFINKDCDELINDLNIISAHVYRFCSKFSEAVAKGEVGAIKKVSDWKDPNNEYVSNWFLLKRLLNI